MCPSAISRAARALALAAALGVAATGAAFSQPAAPATASDDALALLAPVPLSTKNPLLRPQRAYQGVAMADWLLYPSLALGAVYDDNLGWAPKRPRRATGFRVAPDFAAERDVDGHRLLLHAGGDARLFPGDTHANMIDAALGGAYRWRVAPDLTFKATAKVARVSLPVGAGVVATPLGATTLVSPLTQDRAEASLAAQKSFGRAFVGLSFETAKSAFQPLDTAAGRVAQSYRDSWVNTLTGRAGMWVAPTFYVFGEAAGNSRDYTNAPFASKGYRGVAGVGSDRISLFRGELFVGAQQQFYRGPTRWSATSPVFGGKLYWYPLRTLTVRASLDQTFSDSSLPTPANPVGSPARATTAELNIRHQMTRDLSLTTRLVYEVDRFLRTTREDRVWRAGLGVAYNAWRNLDLSLDYEFSKADSTEAASRFRRNVANAGVKYRF